MIFRSVSRYNMQLIVEHVNKVQINLPGELPKGMILQIDTLQGGTAADYVNHIICSLDDITQTGQTYQLHHQTDPVAMHASVIGKMKSTLNDRQSHVCHVSSRWIHG